VRTFCRRGQNQRGRFHRFSCSDTVYCGGRPGWRQPTPCRWTPSARSPWLRRQGHGTHPHRSSERAG
jgi:hypothetical protein